VAAGPGAARAVDGGDDRVGPGDRVVPRVAGAGVAACTARWRHAVRAVLVQRAGAVVRVPGVSADLPVARSAHDVAAREAGDRGGGVVDRAGRGAVAREPAD